MTNVEFVCWLIGLGMGITIAWATMLWHSHRKSQLALAQLEADTGRIIRQSPLKAPADEQPARLCQCGHSMREHDTTVGCRNCECIVRMRLPPGIRK